MPWFTVRPCPTESQNCYPLATIRYRFLAAGRQVQIDARVIATNKGHAMTESEALQKHD